MNDLPAAKTGLLNSGLDEHEQKLKAFWEGFGENLARMRKKRGMAQKRCSIPGRTVRRIEKGKSNHTTMIAHTLEMGPCTKEAVQLIRLFLTLMKPSCAKCDPDCQLNGKDCREILNAFKVVAVLPSRES